METRANYILIGSFTILTLIASIFFVFWLGQIKFNQTFDLYDILFDGNVSGLNIGGEVQFNGISKGEVISIDLDREDPSKVRVRIQVDEGLPVKSDTQATLELQGVTGLALVQLSGGSASADLLSEVSVLDVPEISAQRSTIQELFASAPNVIDQASLAFQRIALLASEKNAASLEQTLDNIATITGAVSNSSEEIEMLLANLSAASGEIDTLLARSSRLIEATETLATTLSGAMDGDGTRLLSELATASQSIGRLSDTTTALIAENRGAIREFSGQGLGEFSQFVAEARQLVITLDRLASKIESDPRSFFLGNRSREFDAQ